jgi:16S rRNA (guanine966-N2)-methyltransferase
MRVVAGAARGRRLRAPSGTLTRPTGDRVREAVFDMLASLDAVEGAVVADLFAGSGAMGVEALSRGAASATFVDRDLRAVQAIRSNLAALGPTSAPVRVVQAEVLSWLGADLGLPAWAGGPGRQRSSSPAGPPRAGRFDLAICDPPYGFERWSRLLDLLARASVGLLVAESSGPVPESEDWRVLRFREYGSTLITLARSATRT